MKWALLLWMKRDGLKAQTQLYPSSKRLLKGTETDRVFFSGQQEMKNRFLPVKTEREYIEHLRV